MKPEYTTRLMRRGDIEQLASWVVDNQDIPAEDKRMIVYPSTFTICVERNDWPVLFVPLHRTLSIGFLGFNPDADAKDKSYALRAAMQSAKNTCDAMKISEIHVATMPDYPMGKWAMKHGFKDSGKHDLYWGLTNV